MSPIDELLEVDRALLARIDALVRWLKAGVAVVVGIGVLLVVGVVSSVVVAVANHAINQRVDEEARTVADVLDPSGVLQTTRDPVQRRRIVLATVAAGQDAQVKRTVEIECRLELLSRHRPLPALGQPCTLP
ncbi:MAG: hypothetical protein LC792_15015 [Actinobacteria bacterium]|nr:hypothetical protein [Actinomycetota bacterium]